MEDHKVIHQPELCHPQERVIPIRILSTPHYEDPERTVANISTTNNNDKSIHKNILVTLDDGTTFQTSGLVTQLGGRYNSTTKENVAHKTSVPGDSNDKSYQGDNSVSIQEIGGQTLKKEVIRCQQDNQQMSSMTPVRKSDINEDKESLSGNSSSSSNCKVKELQGKDERTVDDDMKTNYGCTNDEVAKKYSPSLDKLNVLKIEHADDNGKLVQQQSDSDETVQYETEFTNYSHHQKFIMDDPDISTSSQIPKIIDLSSSCGIKNKSKRETPKKQSVPKERQIPIQLEHTDTSPALHHQDNMPQQFLFNPVSKIGKNQKSSHTPSETTSAQKASTEKQNQFVHCSLNSADEIDLLEDNKVRNELEHEILASVTQLRNKPSNKKNSFIKGEEEITGAVPRRSTSADARCCHRLPPKGSKRTTTHPVVDATMTETAAATNNNRSRKRSRSGSNSMRVLHSGSYRRSHLANKSNTPSINLFKGDDESSLEHTHDHKIINVTSQEQHYCDSKSGISSPFHCPSGASATSSPMQEQKDVIRTPIRVTSFTAAASVSLTPEQVWISSTIDSNPDDSMSNANHDNHQNPSPHLPQQGHNLEKIVTSTANNKYPHATALLTDRKHKSVEGNEARDNDPVKSSALPPEELTMAKNRCDKSVQVPERSKAALKSKNTKCNFKSQNCLIL